MANEFFSEVRGNAAWDGIKEGIKMMIPFLAGLGIKQWVSDHQTALMWTAALVMACAIAYWDQWRIPRRHRATSALPIDANALIEVTDKLAIECASSLARDQVIKERERTIEELKDRISTLEHHPVSDSKLVIHSAIYGLEEIEDIDVTNKLRASVGTALAIRVDNDLVPRDPAKGETKRIEVEYSYGTRTKKKVSRLENELLVLPEDQRLLKDLNLALANKRIFHPDLNSVGRRVETAIYGGPNGTDDVTAKIKALRDGETVAVNHYELCNGQDPSYPTDKFLTVTYSETLRQGATYLSPSRWLKGGS